MVFLGPRVDQGLAALPYEDLIRLQKKYFSSPNQLLTLCLNTNIRQPDEQTIARIQFAREHGLRASIDGADWPEQGETIVRPQKYLGPTSRSFTKHAA